MLAPHPDNHKVGKQGKRLMFSRFPAFLAELLLGLAAFWGRFNYIK